MWSLTSFSAARWPCRYFGTALLASFVACADDNPVSPGSSPVPATPVTPSPRPAPPAAPGSVKLTLSRTDVVFNVMAGAALRDSAAIAVSAASGEALSDLRAIVSHDEGKPDWLAAELDQATLPASLSLRASSPSLPTGDYTATVRLVAPGAAPESLSVTAHVASGPGIGLNATRICFTPTYTGPEARSDDVRITSLDGSPIDGLSATVIYDAGTPFEWLRPPNFTATSAPARLWLTSNMGAMLPGTYHAMVQVSSTTPGVAPVSIRVTLEIRPLQSSMLKITLATVGLGGAGNGRLTATGIDCVLTNGVQSGDCEEPYAPGTVVHVTALPVTGQEFYYISGCPGSCSPTGFDITMAGVSYRFEGGFGGAASKILVRIDWEGPQNGGAAFVTGPHGLWCGYSNERCEALIDGGVGDYEPSPDAELGAAFLRWEGACTGTGQCIVHFDTPGTTRTVTAVFHSRPSTVGPFRIQGAAASGTLSFSAPVTGPSGSPLTCRIVGGMQQGPCEGTIEGAAGTFTITATPDPGSVFVWWQVGGFENFGGGGPLGRCAETSPTCTFTATHGATSFDGIVTFAPASSFSLEIQVQGPGHVSWPYSPTRTFMDCPTICKEYFEPGSTATFTAYPGEGATFLGWTDCTAPSGTTCNMAMTGNRHVVARFGP